MCEYLVGTKRLSCEPWLELIVRYLEDGYFDRYLIWVSQGGGDETGSSPSVKLLVMVGECVKSVVR